ncbi:MAG: hypothetical protein V4581_03505 [Bacteroidota bacterium]
MKRNLLKLSAFLLLGILFTACSGEDTLIEDTNTHSSARASYWSGIIGIDKGNGEYDITADKGQMMNDLEVMLKNQGDTVSLHNIEIVKKKATNDITNEAYMLIATDDIGTSVGIMLARGADNKFKVDAEQDSELANPKTVVCRGCSTGCNLEYLNMPGGKYPYCNENGCGPACSRKEVELD